MIELPDKVLPALKLSPKRARRELLMADALKLYEHGVETFRLTEEQPRRENEVPSPRRQTVPRLHYRIFVTQKSTQFRTGRGQVSSLCPNNRATHPSGRAFRRRTCSLARRMVGRSFCVWRCFNSKLSFRTSESYRDAELLRKWGLSIRKQLNQGKNQTFSFDPLTSQQDTKAGHSPEENQSVNSPEN